MSMRQSNMPPAGQKVEDLLPKELRFIGSSCKDIRAMPDDMADGFGRDLWLIQSGETPESASPFNEQRH